MEAIRALKAGQRAVVKPAHDNDIPAIHGEVAGIDGARVKILVSDTSKEHLADYSANLQCVMVWDERGKACQTPIKIAERNGESLVAIAQDTKEKREFPRVQSTAVFTYEVLPPDRVEAASEDLLNTINVQPEDFTSVERFWNTDDDVMQKLEEEFSRVSHQVAEVNSKLDYLISLSEGGSAKRSAKMYRQIEDFSGAGLGFLENKALPLESVLRMSIELSRFPQLVVHCIGKVVRCEPVASPGGEAPEQHSIGVQFTVIHDEDRERIIRHVFRIQRRNLRARKERSQR